MISQDARQRMYELIEFYKPEEISRYLKSDAVMPEWTPSRALEILREFTIVTQRGCGDYPTIDEAIVGVKRL